MDFVPAHVRHALAGVVWDEAAHLAGDEVQALVVAAFFAYGLILCAAVSLAGGWLEARFPKQFSTIGWECAALLAGLLHIALAFGLLFLLRRKPAAPLFDVTRQEFQKDRQWIQDQQSVNENKS